MRTHRAMDRSALAIHLCFHGRKGKILTSPNKHFIIYIFKTGSPTSGMAWSPWGEEARVFSYLYGAAGENEAQCFALNGYPPLDSPLVCEVCFACPCCSCRQCAPQEHSTTTSHKQTRFLLIFLLFYIPSHLLSSLFSLPRLFLRFPPASVHLRVCPISLLRHISHSLTLPQELMEAAELHMGGYDDGFWELARSGGWVTAQNPKPEKRNTKKSNIPVTHAKYPLHPLPYPPHPRDEIRPETMWGHSSRRSPLGSALNPNLFLRQGGCMLHTRHHPSTTIWHGGDSGHHPRRPAITPPSSIMPRSSDALSHTLP